MRKNLGFIGRTTGAILVSALALQGCGHKSTPLPPRVDAEGATDKAAPKSCEPSAAKLSKALGAEIEGQFSAYVSTMNRLSAQEREAMFVDRDVKGNRISHETSSDDPKAAPWAHLDLKKDGVPGTSTDRAYAELHLGEGTPVTVAVIDSAIDIDHEALKQHIWSNPKHDAAYPGDVHGWNFLGGKNGDVYHTTLEVTRELKRLRTLGQSTTLTSSQQAYLEQIEAAFEKGKGVAAGTLKLRTAARDQLSAALDTLRAYCQVTTGKLEEVQAIQSTNPAITAARDAALVSLKARHDLAWYKSSIEYWTAAIALNDQYYYNLDFDSSTIVGDNPEKMDDIYGDSNVKPEDAEEKHATHVSGIIGAVRGVHAGLEGQAQNVRIMSLRAVPDGDERDKDIGNAIKFAVDHGARVINMSFGKSYSPNRKFVWQMIKYAASKEVVLIHAAGNDSLDNDTISHYPDREVRDDNRKLLETLPNVIEVGASSVNMNKALPASFSDFGSRTVDLFAPGQQIYSTVPGNHYEELDGTSMATPEVAGIAALVLSQFPHLTVAKLKQALFGTVTTFPGLLVLQPSADSSVPDKLVEFSTLSRKGGVANAYEALKKLRYPSTF